MGGRNRGPDAYGVAWFKRHVFITEHTAGCVSGVEQVLFVNECRGKWSNVGVKEKLQLHKEGVSDTCSPGQVHRAAWSSTLGEVPVAELIGGRGSWQGARG